jgi:hypothetical protein
MKFPSLFSSEKSWQVVLLHLGVFCLIAVLFISFHPWYKGQFESFICRRYDVGWYTSIVERGYEFSAEKQSNSAFFPGFPFLWKFSGLGAVGISILNALIYLISIYALKIRFNIKNNIFLFSLAIPSVFFCFVPYSESLFFLGITLMIIGFEKEKYLMILGVLIASFSRSAAFTFIPIFLGMFILQVNKENYRNMLIKYFGLSILSLLVVVLVKYIQYLDTGVWIGIYDPFKHWGTKLTWVQRPITTWGGLNLIWLDGSALFVGIISGVLALKWLINRNKYKVPSEAYLFSILYLLLISVIKVSHAPQTLEGISSLMSVNRYIFAVPPIIFLLNYFQEYPLNLSKFDIYVFLGIILVAAYMFGANPNLHDLKNGDWHHILNKFLYFSGVVLFTLLIFISGKWQKKWLTISLYVILLCIQIGLYFDFLLGRWIG